MVFEDWVKQADKDLGKAVKVGTHNLGIWSGHKAQLLPHYLNYRHLQETRNIVAQNRRLVWATWGLAIATIIINLILIFCK